MSTRCPVLPLRDVVVFPNAAMPLLVGRRRSLAAVAAAAEGNGEILLVAQKRADDEQPSGAALHRVGVLARIQHVSRLPNGATRVLVEARERVAISRFFVPKEVAPAKATAKKKDGKRRSSRSSALTPGTAEPFVEASCTPMPLALDGGTFTVLSVRLRHALSMFEEYAGAQRRLPPEIVSVLEGIDDPVRLAFGLASHLQIPLELRQELLGIPSLDALVDRIGEVLGSELELLRLERRIDEQVRGSLFQNQRDFFLQEQLKAIHKELGQDDGDELEELAAQLTARALPEEVETRAMRELRRLRKLSPMSPEAAVSRGWLDWIAALPWGERTDDTIDLAVAASVLNEDHYGLVDVKERILDHVAVLARVGTVRGAILCLVGPPGVGKTSLARSIARAMGRTFVRISLGGVRDEAEIRGHRRTYVGALPGRIVQAMRRAKVRNPVLLLDELDKLGSDWRGDPAAALLEVLDPEQHREFADHYLEVEYDLSEVLFITTANSLPGIPDALRDRLEIVRLPGYLEQEKLAIATRYLLPRQLEVHGLEATDVVVDTAVLSAMIRGWTREAGVRDLERRIGRLVRKLTRVMAEGTDRSLPIHVQQTELSDFLGVAPFDAEQVGLDDRVGVANGLAYTPIGGEILEIEVSLIPGRGRLQLTGTLGNVMKESASAALTWVRSQLETLGVDPELLAKHDLHVHVPAGATPKDGPSAGIAIATAITSVLTGRAVRGDVAMTGEVTLRGRVLPIGGLREKGVAAHRDRMAHVVIPQQNARDLAELPDDVRGAVSWHPVSSMSDVIALALREQVMVPKKRVTTKRKRVK